VPKKSAKKPAAEPPRGFLYNYFLGLASIASVGLVAAAVFLVTRGYLKAPSDRSLGDGEL
jgi:hypothetical protein